MPFVDNSSPESVVAGGSGGAGSKVNSKGCVSHAVTDEGRCVKISDVPIVAGVEQLWRPYCPGQSVCGVSSQLNTTEDGGSGQASGGRVPGCPNHSRAAGGATLAEVPVAVEPAGNGSMIGEGSLVVETVNEGAVTEESPLVEKLTAGEASIEEEPLSVELIGNGVSLTGGSTSPIERSDCRVRLPRLHAGSGDEFQIVNESLGNHVELPENLASYGDSSGASGAIGDVGFEGCVASDEVAAEAPDEIAVADSLQY
ncbi:hypothetical protein V6N12_049944 [Hibiscus sabdariffa]|uniref:Uncharacterized protein n=1 Tax=Hibiscus sabdariffa TaxID=183260 RepID=A0ABR2GB97_9ROSI